MREEFVDTVLVDCPRGGIRIVGPDPLALGKGKGSWVDEDDDIRCCCWVFADDDGKLNGRPGEGNICGDA